MARRKTKSPPATRTQIVKVQAVAAPVKRRRSAPRRAAPIQKKRRRSGSSVGSTLGGIGRSVGGGRLPLILGAAALGFASSEGWLAKLPSVGKAGPVTGAALIGWAAEEFLHIKLPRLAHDAVTAGLVLSSFNLGFSRGTTVVGDEYAYPGGAVFLE